MSFQTAATMLSLYQAAVTASKNTEDFDAVAKIWSRPLQALKTAVELMEPLVAGGRKNADLENLLSVTKDLRDQAQWIYDLHSGVAVSSSRCRIFLRSVVSHGCNDCPNAPPNNSAERGRRVAGFTIQVSHDARVRCENLARVSVSLQVWKLSIYAFESKT